MKNKVYLGDGLYVLDEGYHMTLSTQRGVGEHYVCLGDDELLMFFKYIEATRNVKITVIREVKPDAIPTSEEK